MRAGRKREEQGGKKRCSTLKLLQVPREQPHSLPCVVGHSSPARSQPPRPCRRGSSGKEPTGGSRGDPATTGGMRQRDPARPAPAPAAPRGPPNLPPSLSPRARRQPPHPVHVETLGAAAGALGAGSQPHGGSPTAAPLGPEQTRPSGGRGLQHRPHAPEGPSSRAPSAAPGHGRAMRERGSAPRPGA